MKKVHLYAYASHVDAVLAEIQRYGAFEFQPLSVLNTTTPDLVFPHATLLSRLQHAIHFLKPYQKPVSMWEYLRKGTPNRLTEASVTQMTRDIDSVAMVVAEIEKLQVELAEKYDGIRALKERINLLEVWKHFPASLALTETKISTTKLVRSREIVDLVGALTVVLDEACIVYELMQLESGVVAVVIERTHESIAAFTHIAEKLRLDIIQAPHGGRSVAEEMREAQATLKALEDAYAITYDQIEYSAKAYKTQLEVTAEVLEWQKSRYAVIAQGASTAHTVLLSGWIRDDYRTKLERSLAEKSLVAVVTDVAPEEGEEPPVEIQNGPLIAPFEVVTRLYGMPGYKDLDPTAFLAAFFFLFFGLCLTDVGYGFALVVASVFILFFTRVDASIKLFAKLLLFIGFSTILIGALFGGYFGVDMSKMPEILQKIQVFDPIGNPLPVFYLALALGVVHVMFGMMLMMYSAARNGNLLGGVLDQGPWLLMFCIGILSVLTSIGWVDVLTMEQLQNLALGNAGLIVVASGRNGEGFIGKIVSAFAGLYSGVGYFSDILSYSRLLALGLATSALAFAVNLIAGMVVDVPYVGFILSFAILLVGHLFTLAINTLGSFVHSARLQFVEFFGKFIVNTGKEFSPLKRTSLYGTTVDD